MKYKICNVIIDETDSERSSGIEMLKEFNYFKKCPRRINYQNHIKINIEIVIEVLGSIGRGKIFIIKYIIEKDLELKCLQINRKMASKEFRNRNDVSRNFCFKNGLNNFGIELKCHRNLILKTCVNLVLELNYRRNLITE